MRVLFMRHGMTVSNLADARMAVRVAKGQVSPSDVHLTTLREAAAVSSEEASGDTCLSDFKGGGIAEARRLGDYWGSLLAEKHAAGEVTFFVSPMQRCLETVDPIMRRLGATASVEPKLMEIPGLCDGNDQLWLERVVRPLFDDGRVAAARSLLQNRRFSRCGLSRDTVTARFPWAISFRDWPQDPSKGWWPGCFERPSESKARVNELKRWLLQLASELPSNHVIILVSHGDTIWNLFSSLLGIPTNSVAHGIANTSVSSLEISANGKVQMDFVNRTPHLVQYDEDVRNLNYYRFMGLKARPMRKGSKQRDLTKEMRESHDAYREFLAKL